MSQIEREHTVVYILQIKQEHSTYFTNRKRTLPPSFLEFTLVLTENLFQTTLLTLIESRLEITPVGGHPCHASFKASVEHFFKSTST